jgi:poly(3-hydroxybutyrate) depolymerase
VGGGSGSTGGRTGTGGTSAAGGSAIVLDGGAGGTDGAAADGGGPSLGCGKTMNRPNPKTQQTIDVGGTSRYYLLDVPSGADNKTPLMLIFALHGYDMNNVSVVGLFNFTSRSGGKAITVYPQGEGPAPGDTSHWGDNVLKSTWMGNEANYNFVRALMTDLESRYCIDTSRVFLAGFSMGGLFTNSTACDHPDWFRAYAPVEGMGPGGSQDGTQPLSCANANAKPAIMIHQGTADTSVKPAEGEKTRDFWSTRNGCNKTTTSAFTGCQSYSACAAPVIYCLGSWTHTIDSQAAGNIWSFFSGLP